ncbi:pyridoxal-phosphate dependent enzyme [Halanaerobium sp. Z-7514]|uniref:Pyridoxal-phosphate dependent enzyme n=1 Tax=Halanaerobium polyolivorans TaxID=2886943 RepID=A0AAW4WWL4_9FIRM|nr:pyridoxal-phosphate dependent enzyme [Halanaerobium polyolivorans]MCC3144173.1 pyridoxal-phosphate dependent enzyme [Halanaerobium polyolivorans]
MYNLNRYQNLNKKLKTLKRVELGFFPTKLYKLENLSKKYQVNLYLKRDDLSGFSTFGGNKIRKLEFLFGDIFNQGAKNIFTFGATQSNHALQTAIACRKYNLNPILYLVDIIGEGMENPKANILLDQILGAEIKVVELKKGENEFDAMERAKEMAQKQAEKISEEKNDYYLIPPGGASAVGTAAFINAYLELKEQEFKQKLNFKNIYHAVGTGGTLAGLSAANAYLEADTKVHGVNVTHRKDDFIKQVAELATEALKTADIDYQVKSSQLIIENNYVGPGYEIPSEKANNTLKLFAEKEGIFLDPVYTAKAAAAMIDHLEKREIEKGSDVLFWHTGGTNALFAEKKLLGSLLDN